VLLRKIKKQNMRWEGNIRIKKEDSKEPGANRERKKKIAKRRRGFGV